MPPTLNRTKSLNRSQNVIEMDIDDYQTGQGGSLNIEGFESSEFFEMISKFDLLRVKETLQNLNINQAITLPQMLDDQGLTLINRAAYDNSYTLAEFVIKFVIEKFTIHFKTLSHEN